MVTLLDLGIHLCNSNCSASDSTKREEIARESRVTNAIKYDSVGPGQPPGQKRLVSIVRFSGAPRRPGLSLCGLTLPRRTDIRVFGVLAYSGGGLSYLFA